MGRKKGKGHVGLDGSHTTVIEGTESLLKAIRKDPLFGQVRPGRISGGQRSGNGERYLNISRANIDGSNIGLGVDTFDLTFRSAGSVSHVLVTIPNSGENLPAAVERIRELAKKHWGNVKVNDRTDRGEDAGDQKSPPSNPSGAALLEKFSGKGKGGQRAGR